MTKLEINAFLAVLRYGSISAAGEALPGGGGLLGLGENPALHLASTEVLVLICCPRC